MLLFVLYKPSQMHKYGQGDHSEKDEFVSPISLFVQHTYILNSSYTLMSLE